MSLQDAIRDRRVKSRNNYISTFDSGDSNHKQLNASYKAGKASKVTHYINESISLVVYCQPGR